MAPAIKLATILIADDDADDRLLLNDAFQESNLETPLHFVSDGEELMDYLLRRGDYGDLEGIPFPGVILLDLNMPRKDGRVALMEIKTNPDLRRIPIVVFTTSKRSEDIMQTYSLGISSYISKPVTFEELCEVVRVLNRYWGNIVALPPECRAESV